VTETTGEPGPEPRCPWCSTAVPTAAERCPSCGATLHEPTQRAEADIPGVTQVDPALTRRPASLPNRLVGWLADVDTEPPSTFDRAQLASGAASAASVAPPSEEVRREMRRLELEALQAELDGRAAEARVAAIEAAAATTASDAPAEPPAGEEPPPVPPAGSEGAAAG
jgi:hypothetical protein